jgi:hypothetical protein
MTSIVAGSIISLVVTLIVGLAYYLWYALALSVVFVKLGSLSWKAWVPIVNEAEILAQGGVPAWSVVYYFIPIVSFYGLYLKITAVHRINLQFHRGAGMTVLGILLPPVWASILAWGKAPASEIDQRVASMLPAHEGGVGPLADRTIATEPTGPVARDASGYAIPQRPSSPPPVPAPAQIEPFEPFVPERPIVSLAPAPIVSVPTPPAIPEVEAHDPAPQLVEVTSERPRTASTFIVNPWAQPATEPADQVEPAAQPDKDASESVAPEAAVPPPVSARTGLERPASFPEAPLTPVISELPATVAPDEGPEESPEVIVSVLPTLARGVANDDDDRPHEHGQHDDEQDDDEDEDEYAATVVVDRRPRFVWSLVLDSGKSFAITADRVALGRNPASDDSDVQLLSLPDSTRTLSKTHATIHVEDGEWTVTDLNSTNGVVVVGDDDAETLLAPGRSSLIPGRFILGKVGMRVASDSEQRP